MSRLDGIIRLHKWELDEKRRVLVSLQEQADAITATIDALRQELEDQKAFAGSESGLIAMGAYLEGFRIREDRLLLQLKAKNDEIAEQHTAVSEAFSELKTYEIAREREIAREAQEEAQREQAEFDEQGIRRSAQSASVAHSGRKP